MAERKFNYSEISNAYNEMKKITGDASNQDSIAGILFKIDDYMHQNVEQCEMAIYGDLGKQLLLDWDNSSSNFDEFVEKFNNWATLVAQSAGNYQKFEQDIKGFKDANPLGATSDGITEAYTNIGFYSNSLTQEQITELASYAQFYQLTGATYVDTGMVEFAGKNKWNRIVGDVLSVAGIVASGVSIFKIFSAGGAYINGANGASRLTVHQTLKGQAAIASKGLTGFPHATKYASTYAKLLLIGGKTSSKIATGFWNSIQSAAKGAALFSVAGATGNILSTISYHIGGSYDEARYSTGNSAGLSAGEGVTLDGGSYCFLGVTPGGTNLYTDDTGIIYYLDSSGKPVTATVTNSNGLQIPANLEQMGDSFSMSVGGETVTENTDLADYVGANYTNYYDSVSGNIPNTFEPVQETN